MDKTRGFTLIEMLLVMSIIMIVGSFGFKGYLSYYEKRQLDAFLAQLEEDILFTQMHAMTHKEVTDVAFYDNFYRVRTLINAPILVERYFLKDFQIEFTNANMTRKISYNNKGNIRVSGKIIVEFKKQRKTIVFQLGKGRFYYE
jgi:competence protein ComGD